MGTVDVNDARDCGLGGDAAISHFIPSVHLAGSRDEKLRKLDTLIRYLQRLRRAIAGEAPQGSLAAEAFGRVSGRWRWFAAGFVTGAMFALLVARVAPG